MLNSPPRSTAWRMADRLLDGQLADRIRSHFGAGRSADELSRQLFAEAGIEVSGRTLGNWAKALGPAPEAAAS